MMPPEVVAQIQAELVSYRDSEMSVMEISHRSALYEEMFQTAKADLRELLAVPKDYKILFLQGGSVDPIYDDTVESGTEDEKYCFCRHRTLVANSDRRCSTCA